MCRRLPQRSLYWGPGRSSCPHFHSSVTLSFNNFFRLILCAFGSLISSPTNLECHGDLFSTCHWITKPLVCAWCVMGTRHIYLLDKWILKCMPKFNYGTSLCKRIHHGWIIQKPLKGHLLPAMCRARWYSERAYMKVQITGAQVVQWLRCCTSSVGGASLIPDWGTKILLATWPKKEKQQRLGVRPTLCCGCSGVLSCCSSCEGSRFIPGHGWE